MWNPGIATFKVPQVCSMSGSFAYIFWFLSSYFLSYLLMYFRQDLTIAALAGPMLVVYSKLTSKLVAAVPASASSSFLPYHVRGGIESLPREFSLREWGKETEFVLDSWKWGGWGKSVRVLTTVLVSKAGLRPPQTPYRTCLVKGGGLLLSPSHSSWLSVVLAM